MTLYLDTSLLVAVLTNEVNTDWVRAWLRGQPTEDLAINEWGRAELSSALSVKLRTDQIEAVVRAQALAAFARLSAGDALHLAICADHGATLCTLDRRLGEAGLVLRWA